MLILLEGCDLTGKSTLAAELSKETGAAIMPFGPPGDTPSYKAHMTWVHRFVTSDVGLIVDRCHWSDLAYGPLWHPENMMDADHFWRVEEWFADYGAVVVLCEREPYQIRVDMRGQVDADHPEVPGMVEHIDEVVTRYDTIGRLSQLPTFTHNIDESPVNIDNLLAVARDRSFFS